MLVLTYLNFFDYASPTFIFLSGWTLCSINHGKTKSARIQKRNVFSTDKNEM